MGDPYPYPDVFHPNKEEKILPRLCMFKNLEEVGPNLE